MKRITYLFVLLAFPVFLSAQMQPMNAAEVALGLAKLNVKGRVLFIAAHPDDENTRLLTYFAKEAKLRTGYFSLTRGDGGQNLIGNEQAELLGPINLSAFEAIVTGVQGAYRLFANLLAAKQP